MSLSSIGCPVTGSVSAVCGMYGYSAWRQEGYGIGILNCYCRTRRMVMASPFSRLRENTSEVPSYM